MPLALPSTSATELQNAARLAPWALGAYGHKSTVERLMDLVRSCRGILEKWQVYNSQGLIASMPHGTIIAIAGTNDGEDWGSNFDWHRYKLEKYAKDHSVPIAKSSSHLYAHTGFLQEASNVMMELSSAYLRLVQPVWVVGHSLGGAIASLLPVIWESLRARVFTFGAPRPFHWTSASPARHPSEHVRIVAIDDLVPQVPLGYAHGPSELKILRGKGQVRRELSVWDHLHRFFRRLWCIRNPVNYVTNAHSVMVYNTALKVYRGEA